MRLWEEHPAEMSDALELHDKILRSWHRASSIEHRASSIEHRASSIEHRASSIEHRASSITAATCSLPWMDLDRDSCVRRGGYRIDSNAVRAGQAVNDEALISDVEAMMETLPDRALTGRSDSTGRSMGGSVQNAFRRVWFDHLNRVGRWTKGTSQMPLHVNKFERYESTDRNDLAMAALEVCRTSREAAGVNSARFFWVDPNEIAILTEADPGAWGPGSSAQPTHNAMAAFFALADLARNTFSETWADAKAGEDTYKLAQ
jgi:hypothetical protein